MKRTAHLIAAAVAIGVTLVSAAPAAASSGLPYESALPRNAASSPATTGQVTWSLAPAAAEAKPDGRVSLRHVVDPGGTQQDRVILTNYGSQSERFAVYASDGMVTEDGNFDIGRPNQKPVDGGSWISFGELNGAAEAAGDGVTLEVAGGAAVVVPIEIAVPADATPGDHPAGIVAELVQDGGAVQIASRVGVRVHLRVAGDVVAAVVPRQVDSRYEPSWNPFAPGTLRVDYTLANEGNVRLGAHTDVSVGGVLGVGSVNSSSATREVLPDQSARVHLALPVWPVVFSWGGVSVAPSVVGDDDVDAKLGRASANFGVWVVPWSQLVLALAIAGTVLLVLRIRRRSAAGVQAQIDAAVAAARSGGPEATPGTGTGTATGIDTGTRVE